MVVYLNFVPSNKGYAILSLLYTLQHISLLVLSLTVLPNLYKFNGVFHWCHKIETIFKVTQKYRILVYLDSMLFRHEKVQWFQSYDALKPIAFEASKACEAFTVFKFSFNIFQWLSQISPDFSHLWPFIYINRFYYNLRITHYSMDYVLLSKTSRKQLQ